MFSNNQDRTEINVNTTIDTFWSQLSSLNIGCYNEKISLRWLPAAGVDERGYTRYNKDARVSTCISHTKISALLRKYDEHLKPLVESKADPGESGKSIMVPINAKTGIAGLFIEYKKDENGKPSLYLTFAQKLTEVGADPSNIISFKFGDLTMMTDMSPEKGGGEEVTEPAEFQYFIDILRSHIFTTGLNSHATRYSMAFKNRYSRSNESSENTGMDSFASMMPDTDGLSVFS